MKSDRELPCEACRTPVDDLLIRPDPSAISRVLQMREEMSEMP